MYQVIKTHRYLKDIEILVEDVRVKDAAGSVREHAETFAMSKGLDPVTLPRFSTGRGWNTPRVRLWWIWVGDWKFLARPTPR